MESLWVKSSVRRNDQIEYHKGVAVTHFNFKNLKIKFFFFRWNIFDFVNETGEEKGIFFLQVISFNK